MQKGDLALIVRNCGWQGETLMGNAVGFIVEIKNFDPIVKCYATKLVSKPFSDTWWCMEEELCKIPEELKNEPIEVIKLYCNL